MSTLSLRRPLPAVAVVILTAAGLVASLAGCNLGGAAFPALPTDLHGLPLVESLSGEEAREEIGRMHGKGVAPEESRIGIYASNDLRAAIYVSRFGSPGDARAQLEAMSVKMGPGSSGFEHHATFEVRDIEVHAAVGYGHQHFFWALGADVVWLTVPASLARPALAELLRVDVDAIPRYAPLSWPHPALEVRLEEAS